MYVKKKLSKKSKELKDKISTGIFNISSILDVKVGQMLRTLRIETLFINVNT